MSKKAKTKKKNEPVHDVETLFIILKFLVKGVKIEFEVLEKRIENLEKASKKRI